MEIPDYVFTPFLRHINTVIDRMKPSSDDAKAYNAFYMARRELKYINRRVKAQRGFSSDDKNKK